MVPVRQIRAYRKALAKIEAATADRLGTALSRLDWSREISELREDVVAVMEAVLDTSTEASARVAAAFFEGMRKRQMGEAAKAVISTARDAESTRVAVVSCLDPLASRGDVEASVNLLQNRASYELKRAAGSTIYENGKIDGSRVYYARVPGSDDSCQFCLMLASRGFVYRSSEAAGENDHYHANCECVIVPSWTRDSIEGYTQEDRDRYYEQTLQFQEAQKGRKR